MIFENGNESGKQMNKKHQYLLFTNQRSETFSSNRYLDRFNIEMVLLFSKVISLDYLQHFFFYFIVGRSIQRNPTTYFLHKRNVRYFTWISRNKDKKDTIIAKDVKKQLGMQDQWYKCLPEKSKALSLITSTKKRHIKKQ